jgi:hypothetical protein
LRLHVIACEQQTKSNDYFFHTHKKIPLVGI